MVEPIIGLIQLDQGYFLLLQICIPIEIISTQGKWLNPVNPSKPCPCLEGGFLCKGVLYTGIRRLGTTGYYCYGAVSVMRESDIEAVRYRLSLILRQSGIEIV